MTKRIIKRILQALVLLHIMPLICVMFELFSQCHSLDIAYYAGLVLDVVIIISWTMACIIGYILRWIFDC